MAKFLIVILLLFPLHQSVSAGDLTWSAGTDLLCLDFLYQDGARVTFEGGARWRDVRFSVPVTYAWSLGHDLAFLDISLRIDCYPFEDLGLFFGVDAVRWGRFFGRGSPDERNLFPTAIYAGWTIRAPYFIFEPRIIVTDPARTGDVPLAPLREHFFMYGSFYAELFIGMSI